MDLSTWIGLSLGIGCVWYTLYAGNILNLLWDFPSFVLVVGGTIASTLMTYPLEVMKNTPRTLALTFFPHRNATPNTVIDRLCALSETANLRGVDALPDEVTPDDDEFLRSGIKMILSDFSPEEIRECMDNDMGFMLERHTGVQKAFVSAGGYAPVYGLLGTLVGVLGVLRYLGDPTAMGQAMTVAIITTFYGIFIANFIALPTAGKLETYSGRELLNKQLTAMAIMAMKKEENTFLLRQKLEKHVAKSLREKNEQR